MFDLEGAMAVARLDSRLIASFESVLFVGGEARAIGFCCEPSVDCAGDSVARREYWPRSFSDVGNIR